MLPLGNIRAWQTSDNWTHFTKDEQFTLMTLWCIARSPLILGANLPQDDDFTLSLLTNDEILAVDQNSANNRQLFNTNNQVAWIADVPGSKDKYLALFNTSPTPLGGRRGGFAGPGAQTQPPTNSLPANPGANEPREISVSLADLSIAGPTKVRDLWHHQDLGIFTGTLTQSINSHGAGLYRIHP
jgi:hypothetical protein